MSKGLRIGIAAVVACAAMVLVAPASAGSGASTKVTIQHQQGGFFGDVISPRDKCEANRDVALYKQRGGNPRPHHDRLLGTDIAQPNGPNGMWSINTKRHHGKFYAFAHKTSACQKGISPTLTLP